jgi:ectoine hydroxylase-related dioxygenase (phytanoyl-CoA dioxygenase family)
MLKTQINHSFIDNGYIVAENVISKSLADDLRREAQEIEATIPVEESMITEGIYCGDDWFTCLPNYPAFERVGKSPVLIETIEEILQSPCELVLWFLRRIQTGQGNTLWHQDVDILYSGAKIGVTFSSIGSQGNDTALKVIPKSNRWQTPKKEQMHVSHPNELSLNISGQTAIVQDPLLWHTSCLNSDPQSQWLLFLFYKVAPSNN